MKFDLLIVSLIIVLVVGCQQQEKIADTPDQIRLNQIGYYPQSTKEFILSDLKAKSFKLVNQAGDTVLAGSLVERGQWVASGEQITMGDFSALQVPGRYTILLDNGLQSYPFVVSTDIYGKALKGAIKSYYFQRASMPIEEQYGGIYTRAAGHSDNNCAFHPSSGHDSGSLSSPGGWYDAGDYGKYIVNAAFSVGQMLDFVEQFPEAIADGDLNIPESGNEINDLLDELKYELDWILTMQDEDGGVYHKLTAKSFSGFIMPDEYDLERLIIGKGTAATLDFAAVLAQSSRIYSKINPEWSTAALASAQKAWNWAIINNNVPFSNPEDVVTGEYGDTIFTDDFYWAASELYLTTKAPEYLDYLKANEEPYIHELTNSWKYFVRNNAFHSLLENRLNIDDELSKRLISSHMALANEILIMIDENPYHIGLGRYEWGSNSDILNQAIILCYAHRITGDQKYLDGVDRITDYIFGKNARGYSFLTGFGAKQAMFPHHRPSGADGVDDPVPGFIIGGPNGDKQDAAEVNYQFTEPAKSYEDVQPSYASNEVCINWNAPAVYVLGYLEAVR